MYRVKFLYRIGHFLSYCRGPTCLHYVGKLSAWLLECYVTSAQGQIAHVFIELVLEVEQASTPDLGHLVE